MDLPWAQKARVSNLRQPQKSYYIFETLNECDFKLMGPRENRKIFVGGRLNLSGSPKSLVTFWG